MLFLMDAQSKFHKVSFVLKHSLNFKLRYTKTAKQKFFCSWGVAFVLDCWGVKVILTEFLPLCVETQYCPVLPTSSPCRCQPLISVPPPITRPQPHAAQLCPFPTLHRHLLWWHRHMFCCWLSCMQGKGGIYPAVSLCWNAPSRQGIRHAVLHILVLTWCIHQQ